MPLRSVEAKLDTTRMLEGGGFPVRRPFPTHKLDMLDPFLLLDHMGPVTWGPDEAIGAPDHPHRGFETVTYLLSGHMEHKDSAGYVARIGPGDVQWMTAGAGIVHSEMPEPSFKREGGTINGFQLWVNLPRSQKMISPRYQELRTRVTQSDDGLVRARVIAGEALGVSASIETQTPIFYHHFSLEPGAVHLQPAPPDFNTFAYVFGGELDVVGEGGHRTTAADGQAVLWAADGDTVHLGNAGTETTELLLIGGVPLNEPVARYGPFVMNTPQELRQAFDDYQAGKLGRIEM